MMEEEPHDEEAWGINPIKYQSEEEVSKPARGRGRKPSTVTKAAQPRKPKNEHYGKARVPKHNEDYNAFEDCLEEGKVQEKPVKRPYVRKSVVKSAGKN